MVGSNQRYSWQSYPLLSIEYIDDKAVSVYRYPHDRTKVWYIQQKAVSGELSINQPVIEDTAVVYRFIDRLECGGVSIYRTF